MVSQPLPDAKCNWGHFQSSLNKTKQKNTSPIMCAWASNECFLFTVTTGNLPDKAPFKNQITEVLRVQEIW